MSDVYSLVAIVGLALIALALGSGLTTVRNHERRLADLERRANPASKHDALYLARQDIGEATLFDLAHMRTEVETLTAWMEYASGRARHVASGGSPNDPPTKWSKQS